MDQLGRVLPLGAWFAYTKTKYEVETKRCHVAERDNSTRHKRRTTADLQHAEDSWNLELEGRLCALAQKRDSPLKASVNELKSQVERMKMNLKTLSLASTSSSSPDIHCSSRSYNGGERCSLRRPQESPVLRSSSKSAKSVKFSERGDLLQDAEELLGCSEQERKVSPALVANSAIDSLRSAARYYYLRVTVVAGRYCAVDSPDTELTVGKVSMRKVRFKGQTVSGGFRLFDTAERAMNAGAIEAASRRYSLMRVQPQGIVTKLHPGSFLTTAVLAVDVIPAVVSTVLIRGV